jgi:hypothetical protein
MQTPKNTSRRLCTAQGCYGVGDDVTNAQNEPLGTISGFLHEHELLISTSHGPARIPESYVDDGSGQVFDFVDGEPTTPE